MYINVLLILLTNFIKIYLNQNININLILKEKQYYQSSLEKGTLIYIIYTLNSTNNGIITFEENSLILKGETSTINLSCSNTIPISTEPNKNFTLICTTLTSSSDTEYTLSLGKGKIISSNQNEKITVNVSNNNYIYGHRNITMIFTLKENQVYNKKLFGLIGFNVSYIMNETNKGDLYIDPGVLILVGNCDNISISCGYIPKGNEPNVNQNIVCRTRETGNCSYYSLDIGKKDIVSTYPNEKINIIINDENNPTFDLKKDTENVDNNNNKGYNINFNIFFFYFLITLLIF
jgi:hypothetical protein